MGVTQYVSITTKEYAMWNRLEGAVRATLKATSYAAQDVGIATMREALKDLDERRNGAKQ